MKRRSCRSWVCLSAHFLFLVFWTGEAFAAFHFMRIDEVMAGAGGNPEIQFVELQTTSSFQNFVSGQRLEFFDASGNLTGSFTIPGNVQNGASSSSILIGTEAFNAVSTVAPDFIMPRGIVAPGGRVCYAGSDVDPCVSYGNYTGSMTVRGFNYGAPASALPLDGVQSLKRVRTAFPFNNSTDFVLGPPAPRNNAGQSGVVQLPPPPVCVLAAPPAGCLTPGSSFQADGRGSQGPGPLTFRFQVTPSDGVSIESPEARVSSILFAQSGNYTVRLTVRNAGGESSCEVQVCVQPVEPSGNRFQRGDCNGDASTDISDAVSVLFFLFTVGEPPPCAAACNANTDTVTDTSDVVFILSFLFTGGPPPAPLFPACERGPVTDCARETCAG